MYSLKPMTLRTAARFIFIVLLAACSNRLPAQLIHSIAGGSVGDGKTASTIAIVNFTSITTDDAGNLYAYDFANHLVRKMDAVTTIMSTVAGGGQTYADSMPALTSRLDSIRGIAVDKAGNIYIAAETRLFKVVISSGKLFRIAGKPYQTSSADGDNGLARNAGFQLITSIAVDTSGNIYVTDEHKIRKINQSTGIISAAGGKPAAGYSGDGGLATNAAFRFPNSITIDRFNNIYVNDDGNELIRKISGATGIVTSVAGVYQFGGSMGDGGPATSAKISPDCMGTDIAGNIYFSEAAYARIRKITVATGIISAFAGTGVSGNTGNGGPALAANIRSSVITIDKQGNIYLASSADANIRKITLGTNIISQVCGNGSSGWAFSNLPLNEAQLNELVKIAIDNAGNIYMSDFYNNKIHKIDQAGQKIVTVLGTGAKTSNGGNGGNGGPAINATVFGAGALATDTGGNFYFVDGSHSIRKVTIATGIVSPVAGTGVVGFSGDGGPATAAKFNTVTSIAIDKAGNIYLADMYNNRIRKITVATGIITTIAGTGGGGSTGDGGPATAAVINQPTSITLDKNGNLYIAASYAIRRIDAATGIITTVAGNGISNAVSDGDGGLAIAAKIHYPNGVAADDSGNIYINEAASRIRKVDHASGIITTIAGGNKYFFYGDGIPAKDASLQEAGSIVLDDAGRLYFADNTRVRMIGQADTGVYKAYIHGTVFFDNNANNIKDTGEAYAENITIAAGKPGTELQTVTRNGFFKLLADTGTYTTSVKGVDYLIVSPGSYTSNFTGTHTADTIQFALQPVPVMKDLVVYLVPIGYFRPGNTVHYRIFYKNAGTGVVQNARVQFLNSSRSAFVKSIPARDATNAGDTLYWSLPPLVPTASGYIDIEVLLGTPPQVNQGDSLFLAAAIYPAAEGLTPSNNTAFLKVRVGSSYDPNDKTELHGGAISPAQVAAGEYLQYTIRFQNTGNDTAFTITVTDTLGALLDPASFRMIAASHDYQLTIGGGNKLSWVFNNILLPDSNTNEKDSHGFICFRIKPLPSVIEGNVIRNKSDIYFDFNLPVTTNLATTMVKQLPAPPARPVLDTIKQWYCAAGGEQKIKLVNFNTGYHAKVLLNNTSLPIAADSTFSIFPGQLQPGNYPVRVEYVNETRDNYLNTSFGVVRAALPEVAIAASKISITVPTDVCILVATNKKDGGASPLFAFSGVRDFSSLLQAESGLNTVTLRADQLTDGDNRVYVRMKTADSCYSRLAAYDSLVINKSMLTTGITDIDNPTLSITSFPNPFTDVISVAGLMASKTYHIEMYNSVGAIVYSAVVSNGTHHLIYAGRFAKGQYWIGITDARKNKLLGSLSVVGH